MGFDELGEHGMIVGEIENKKLNLEFVKLDDTEFTVLEQKVDKFLSKEDLIEHLNSLELDENKLYEIELIGKRNFEINVREIFKLLDNYSILKIKDSSKVGYNLDELKKEKNLTGLFVKEALNLLESQEYSKEEIEKAIEIGLNSLEN
jgi:hypothetical protein